MMARGRKIMSFRIAPMYKPPIPEGWENWPQDGAFAKMIESMTTKSIDYLTLRKMVAHKQ